VSGALSRIALARQGGDMPWRVSRRRLMFASAGGLPATLGLPVFARDSFQSLDLTGADFGRDFHLSDPDGRVRSLADFRGKVVLLFFGFTQCPDVCPTALARAAKVKQLLGAQADKLQVIFVTLDPERDSPVVLRAYTQAFHPTFLGLRGDAHVTQQTAQEFKIFFAKVPTGSSYSMDHTAISYAFDPRGKLRLAIRHAQSAESVAADVRLLLKDA
jgi:protein SCO1/2